jgi:crotonobetainyl-CoA:carnitine CoA-transferase CaiB-like acyl-CoA transferase
MSASAPSGPLAGVRIVDLTAVVLGAYATQLLGDLGADVIKIEAPGGPGVGGDIMRWGGENPAGPGSGFGPMFMMYNRNKRSVTLDLKTEAGREALFALVRTADAFVANRPASALEKLGVGYAAVRAVRPDIVYVNAPGYGSQGPYADFPAYDELVQAGSGAADFHVRTTGEDHPRYIPTLAADKTVGLFLVQATLAGLFHKARTGEGQAIEAPMLECFTHFNLSENLYGHVFDPPVGDYGYGRILNPERRPYRTKDGWIAVSPYSDRNWQDFFDIVGEKARFLADERFAKYANRIRNIRALYAMVETYTVTKTSDEWFEACSRRNIPCMRVHRLDTLESDAHLAAVGFFEKYDHPVVGGAVGLKHPVTYGATPADARAVQPALGQHTEECLREAGLDAATLARLKAAGAFG